MSYNPTNPNGAAVSASSAPVVTATDDANLKGLAAAAAGAYVRQDSNATIAKESGGNLATIATDVAPLVASAAGGYVRQDSTGTIAKESGGNLATLAGAVTSTVMQANVKQINGVTPLMGNGVTGTGSQRVTIASDTSTNTNPFYVKQQAQTTGGATPYQLISAASTNATSLKGSAGTIYGIQVYNNSTTTNAYLKIYNKASAPTVGTDTPIKTIMIPFGGGSNVPIPDVGIALGTGIAFAITGGMAVSDTTAVAVTQVAVNIDYV
jgi:hypothetical protein